MYLISYIPPPHPPRGHTCIYGGFESVCVGGMGWDGMGMGIKGGVRKLSLAIGGFFLRVGTRKRPPFSIGGLVFMLHAIFAPRVWFIRLLRFAAFRWDGWLWFIRLGWFFSSSFLPLYLAISTSLSSSSSFSGSSSARSHNPSRFNTFALDLPAILYFPSKVTLQELQPDRSKESQYRRYRLPFSSLSGRNMNCV